MINDNERQIFLRQRRNLMGISIVVFFFTYSGLKLTKLNILGNEFDLPNSYIVNISLWVIFIYWFVRYFQYLPATNIYKTYADRLFALIRPYAEKAFESEADNIKVEKPRDATTTRPRLNQVQWEFMPSGWNPFTAKRIKIFYDVDVILSNGKTVPRSTSSFEYVLDEGGFSNFKFWWKAVNFTIWRSPFVTEYVIPPLLAFVAATASAGFLFACQEGAAVCLKAAAPSVPAPAFVTPSAKEVFELRAKCAELADVIMRDNMIGPALTQSQASHYNPRTNRCWVELDVSTADLSSSHYQLGRYLYDGQTKEMLAVSRVIDEKKSGNVFDGADHKTINYGNAGFDDANDYITAMMADNRQQ